MTEIVFIELLKWAAQFPPVRAFLGLLRAGDPVAQERLDDVIPKTLPSEELEQELTK